MVVHMAEMTPTPAQLRAAAEDALKPLGQERIRLITRLEELDKELKPLVVQALAAEVSERRISVMTALARGTIRTWGGKTDKAAAVAPAAPAVPGLPATAVPCPACGAEAGALCTSHSGTRQRRNNVHQARTAAWKEVAA
jgi:hypothetical protein